MVRRFSPVRSAFAVLTGFTLIALFVVWQMINQPWLGLSFIVPPMGDGLVVASVARNGPAFNNLESNQRIRLIKGAHDTVLLNGQLLESTEILPTYKAFNEYLTRQQRVADILKEDVVTFVLDNGKAIAITPVKQHPVSAIPMIHFLNLLSGFFCVGVGLLLWRYRLELYVSRLILAGGVGAFVYYLSVVLQYRELALPANWLYVAAAANSVSANIFAWSYFTILLVYPVRVSGSRVVWLLLVLALLISLNSILQWLELPFHVYLFQFLFVGLGVYFLLFWQWRITQGRPVERATVKLFVMMMVVPTALVILLWLTPLILREPVLISHELARFVFIPIVLSWVIAAFRYHLFNVEKWWFISVMWMIGIMLLLAPYTIFIYLLNLEPLLAFSLSLVIGGALYYPIEHRFIFQLLPELPRSTDDTLSGLVHSLQTATTDAGFQSAWQKALETRFHPISINYLTEKLEKVAFRDEGQVLHVPNVVEGSCYKLLGKNQGNRLFNIRDVKAIESLLMLTRAILRASRAREEATLTERTRIMRDLHDSLGAKLLSMLQRSRGQPSAEDAREALQTLRDTVHLSTVTKPQDLSDLLGEWRMETQERLEIADVRLHWQMKESECRLKVSSEQVLLLRSFLREAISNALKHAQPENVFVYIEQVPELLKLSVRNDGCVIAPEQWKFGFGLSQLRERLIRADGKLEISQRQIEEPGIIVEVLVLLPVWHK